MKNNRENIVSIIVGVVVAIGFMITLVACSKLCSIPVVNKLPGVTCTPTPVTTP